MQVKQVYVNDLIMGEAQTWADVYRLLGKKGVRFEGKPGAAEGPTAFFLYGAVVMAGNGRSEVGSDVA